jgi:uncharacterized membrane protein YecN with MAPEG domain
MVPGIPITALYAGLLTLVMIALGAAVGIKRARTGISIMYGDDMELATRIRRHGNFTESVPLTLLLLAALELNGASPGVLHGLGIALLLSRIAHPFGLRHDDIRNPLRGLGNGVSTLVTLVAALMLIWGFVTRS